MCLKVPQDLCNSFLQANWAVKSGQVVIDVNDVEILALRFMEAKRTEKF